MSNIAYKIVEFDLKAMIPRLLFAMIFSLSLTWLNTKTSSFPWVKAGENFVLFFPVLVGMLLYGFATGAVFGAGQAAWGRVTSVVREGNKDKIEAVLDEKPDLFPTMLMVAGWFILILSSLMIQVPIQMLFLLFCLHLTLIFPLMLALDYWGFTDGIKRIERVGR